MKTATATVFRSAAAGLCVLLLGACDLGVTNPNEPDRERALATGGDVESLIASSFKAFYDFSQSGNRIDGAVPECEGEGPSWMAVLNALADHTTSSWSNFGFQRTTGEPRTAIPNSQANTDACLMSTPWFVAYGGLAAAAEGMRAINAGVEIGDDGANTPRARAFAKFSQGLIHGMLALIFDKAFVVDETTQLVDEQGNPTDLPFASYQEMLDASIGYLQEAISIAEANNFTTPGPWMNGRQVTSDELVGLAHSYIARFMARVPRNPSEREAVDWEVVEDHIDQGHTFDFTIQSSGFFGDWFSGLKWWGLCGGGCFGIALSEMDYKTVGPADQSGRYQDWVNSPPPERDPFDIESPDARIPEPADTDQGCLDAPVDDPSSASFCGNGPAFIGYHVRTYFPKVRGIYQLSHYSRYEQWFGQRCGFFTPGFVFNGPVCEFTQRDLAFLEAEARMRQGDMQGGADIINQFRVAEGELPPADANGVQGQENCVPKRPDGSCGDLWDVLAYEKGMAIGAEHAGDMWADKRGWGRLTAGTAIHLPVPAKELNVIGEEIYTFGGAAGGAALKAGEVPIIKPGNLESILAKVKWSLEVLEQMDRAVAGRAPAGPASVRSLVQ